MSKNLEEIRKNKKFPYALSFLGSKFDNTGQLILRERSKGLTCATFVLAIFKTVGIDLVKEDEWPARYNEDLEFLETLSSFATPEHLKLLKKEVEEGCKRIRPAEVLGSCTCNVLPAEFVETSAASKKIVNKLAGTQQD